MYVIWSFLLIRSVNFEGFHFHQKINENIFAILAKPIKRDQIKKVVSERQNKILQLVL